MVGTNLRRTSLRAFSSLSSSQIGEVSTSASDCTLSSMSLICCALAAVCCRKQSAVDRVGYQRILYIIVLDENRECAHDGLER